jgi:hypothetical protein
MPSLDLIDLGSFDLVNYGKNLKNKQKSTFISNNSNKNQKDSSNLDLNFFPVTQVQNQ